MKTNTNVRCHLFQIERPAQSSVGNWNLSFMMISRRTNDCRTRDYSHERVNKVYLKRILSQLKRWLVLSLKKNCKNLKVVVAMGDEGTNDEVWTKEIFSL